MQYGDLLTGRRGGSRAGRAGGDKNEDARNGVYPRRVAVGTHVRENDDLHGREFRPVVQPLARLHVGRNGGLAARFARRAITRALYLCARTPASWNTRGERDASYRYLSRSKPRVKITPIRYEGRGRDCLINPAGVKSKLIHCGFFAEAKTPRFTSLSSVKLAEYSRRRRYAVT